MRISDWSSDVCSSDLVLTDKGRLIATYALCGFANFSSIAIQIGGIGGLAPERRGDLTRLGQRAALRGSLATCLTPTIAGGRNRLYPPTVRLQCRWRWERGTAVAWGRMGTHASSPEALGTL